MRKLHGAAATAALARAGGRGAVVISVLALLLSLAGCGDDGSPMRGLLASEIPIARTPPGGFGDTFPEPVLARCSEPLVEGAPDLRGLWKTLRAERNGTPVDADDRIHFYVERIEQCGNRIVDMGGGTIADARADGTEENGVRDVSAFDFTTPIHVIASYEDSVFVLRPVGIPGIEITRRLDADGHMVWTRPDRGNLVVTLERIGDGAGTPPNTFAPFQPRPAGALELVPDCSTSTATAEAAAAGHRRLPSIVASGLSRRSSPPRSR